MVSKLNKVRLTKAYFADSPDDVPLAIRDSWHFHQQRQLLFWSGEVCFELARQNFDTFDNADPENYDLTAQPDAHPCEAAAFAAKIPKPEEVQNPENRDPLNAHQVHPGSEDATSRVPHTQSQSSCSCSHTTSTSSDQLTHSTTSPPPSQFKKPNAGSPSNREAQALDRPLSNHVQRHPGMGHRGRQERPARTSRAAPKDPCRSSAPSLESHGGAHSGNDS